MTPFVLHLLRHGAPKTPGLFLGQTDMPSTAEGIAACLARAQDLEVEAIVSSDLTRTAAAAEAIAGPRGIPPRLDPRWRELDFGTWDGLASQDIDQQALARFWLDPDAHAPPEGERWSDLLDRVGAALIDLAPRPTLIVTHAGAMRAVLSALSGLDNRVGWAFDLPYAALLSLRVWPASG